MQDIKGREVFVGSRVYFTRASRLYEGDVIDLTPKGVKVRVTTPNSVNRIEWAVTDSTKIAMV